MSKLKKKRISVGGQLFIIKPRLIISRLRPHLKSVMGRSGRMTQIPPYLARTLAARHLIKGRSMASSPNSIFWGNLSIVCFVVSEKGQHRIIRFLLNPNGCWLIEFWRKSPSDRETVVDSNDKPDIRCWSVRR